MRFLHEKLYKKTLKTYPEKDLLLLPILFDVGEDMLRLNVSCDLMPIVMKSLDISNSPSGKIAVKNGTRPVICTSLGSLIDEDIVCII